MTNIDIDRDGNKTQGLTASELRNLQTLAEQISANTGADIPHTFIPYFTFPNLNKLNLNKFGIS